MSCELPGRASIGVRHVVPAGLPRRVAKWFLSSGVSFEIAAASWFRSEGGSTSVACAESAFLVQALEQAGSTIALTDCRSAVCNASRLAWGARGRSFKSCRPDSVQKQALRRERRRAFSLTREEILFSFLLRLRIEKVVHHRDDDGHALHQRDVCRVGQYGQSRF